MLKSLIARLFAGRRTGESLPEAPKPPPVFAGRPVIDGGRCTGCGVCSGVCPTGALTVDGQGTAMDIGKCLFCRECEEACPTGAIVFSREHRLAASEREELIVRSGGEAAPRFPGNGEFMKRRGKPLKLWVISTGGCAACGLDFSVSGTAAWERFGIQAAASPKHADCLLITGPVNRAMHPELRKVLEEAPHPPVIIACGSCAVSGGLYAAGPEGGSGAAGIVKPDLWIPGCPPHPATVLEGILGLMDRSAAAG